MSQHSTTRFAPFDRVVVTLPTGEEARGEVLEAGGPSLLVDLHDGRTVFIPARDVKYDEPTDTEIYGAGSD